MNYKITNGLLTVEVNDLGAQLQSIRLSDGTEYLWQGDATYWSDRAPVLFPYIARLTNGTYSYKDTLYHLPIHGFAPTAQFSPVEQLPDSICFRLTDSAQTLEIYPFRFVFDVCYTLKDDSLQVSYRVQNCGEETMYFGVGGHPGFRVPLEAGLRFEDYALRFARPCSPVRVGFTADCFRSGHDTPLLLHDGQTLPLRHELFDDDAIILKDMDHDVMLFAPNAKHAVQMQFSGFDYLGFWHRPKTDAPYVCLEPWSSLPSRAGVVEDLQTQLDLLQLPAHGCTSRSFRLRFT